MRTKGRTHHPRRARRGPGGLPLSTRV